MDSLIAAEIARLEKATVSSLVAKFEEIFGQQCRSRNKRYLIRRIAWRLQADAEGGLSDRALKRAAELALDSEVRVTPPKQSKNQLVVVTDVRSTPVETIGCRLQGRCCIENTKASRSGCWYWKMRLNTKARDSSPSRP